METAGHAIGITGGHCDENGFKPGVAEQTPLDGVADGPEQIRQAVRLQIKYGATVIKTCATGGVLSEGDAVGATQYSFEELKALVDEANKLERKVAAHAHGTEGIKLAVRAGVSSIEHGSFLDEEGARLMKERGTFLVPTLSAAEAVERAAKNGVLKGLRAEKALAAAASVRHAIKLAVSMKVQIALGTDAGVIPHGTNGREFFLMVDWGGMTNMEAIQAGTMNGAKLLGWDKNLGSLTTGKWADIVAVSGDPFLLYLRDGEAVFVMKNGGFIGRIDQFALRSVPGDSEWVVFVSPTSPPYLTVSARTTQAMASPLRCEGKSAEQPQPRLKLAVRLWLWLCHSDAAASLRLAGDEPFPFPWV
jgi:imidazolonepropionase-like amidohydrolase